MRIIQHQFVEFIPDTLEVGLLYITLEYRTAVHSCICGCGNKVVTPFSPRDWKLIFDGKTVSLTPSIGNWNFDCKSHYWITNNQIRHAAPWAEYLKQEEKPLPKKKKKSKPFSSLIKKLKRKS